MGKEKNYCIDCGAEIDRKATRCHSCAAKACWERGDYDDRHTEEWRRKKSEAMKAAWGRGDFDGRETEECRRKVSEAKKAAWERGDYDSEEYRRKISEAMKAAHGRGDYDSEECRRKKSEARKAAWEQGVYDGVFQSPTGIELQVAAALDIMSIEHESQHRPDNCRWPYDEFVPPNILIEVQGDYWHGDNFPEQQERDAEKSQWAKDNGFELITIWEHEIEEQGAWAIIAQAFA